VKDRGVVLVLVYRLGFLTPLVLGSRRTVIRRVAWVLTYSARERLPAPRNMHLRVENIPGIVSRLRTPCRRDEQLFGKLTRL
jgi:hypothetical protein